MVTIKTYGDDYPDGIAGHVAHDALNMEDAPAVNTTHGTDWGFTGDDLAKETDDTYEGVGQENTARRIGAVEKTSIDLRSPYPVEDVADHANFGNLTFNGTDPVLLLKRNIRRRLVTITNQGAALLLVSNQKIVFSQGLFTAGFYPPSAIYLPVGAGRDLRYRGPLYICAPTGTGTVDWIEETY